MKKKEKLKQHVRVASKADSISVESIKTRNKELNDLIGGLSYEEIYNVLGRKKKGGGGGVNDYSTTTEFTTNFYDAYAVPKEWTSTDQNHMGDQMVAL